MFADMSGESFDPKEWINRSLATETEGAGGAEPADMRLSVLLTKLQMQASDVDGAIHDAAQQVAAVAPQMVRDIASVKEQVSAVRADMAALMDEVTDVEASSEASVALLREVLLVKQRMAAVRQQQMLRAAAFRQRQGASAAAGGAAVHFSGEAGVDWPQSVADAPLDALVAAVLRGRNCPFTCLGLEKGATREAVRGSSFHRWPVCTRAPAPRHRHGCRGVQVSRSARAGRCASGTSPWRCGSARKRPIAARVPTATMSSPLRQSASATHS